MTTQTRIVKVATITPTVFHVHLTGSVPPTVARAMGEWLARHGIDSSLVPETAPIVRSEEGCSIVYHEIHEAPPQVRLMFGLSPGQVMASPVTMQGTKPPEPWPREVLEWGDRIK